MMNKQISALFVEKDGKLCMAQWNPLVDDGDALQLLGDASKTPNINTRSVEIVIGGGVSSVRIRDFYYGWECCGLEEHHNDPGAATRRAIVCAVAEIGRGLK